MGLVDSLKSFFGGESTAQPKLTEKEKVLIAVQDMSRPFASGAWNGSVMFTQSFNGEKNFGEIGPIKRYTLDYVALRARAWQSFIESEITQTVINKYVKWVVGSGLSLKAEPIEQVLRQSGVDIGENFAEKFAELTEVHWKLWSESTGCDISDGMTLGQIAREAKKNAIVGGDCLVVLRYIDGEPKVQLIDGANVYRPGATSSETMFTPDAEGNVWVSGVKYDNRGRVLAYSVRKEGSMLDYTEIPAYGDGGKIKLAFMVYGLKYRLENKRGISLISVILETLKKLERYKEATVGSAEERQKIAYSVEHQVFSTGQNPLLNQMANSLNIESSDQFPQTDDDLRQLADKVAATTNKMAFNMPKGAQLKVLESKNELYFKDFYTVNVELICAALGIPPEVAMSKYDSNFSASRAALKDWEHTIMIDRADFTAQFYRPTYAFWFHVQALQGLVSAPGYLMAYMNQQKTILRAYLSCRFTGPGVPHIDPLKEVEAERRKLGELGKDIPLTTVEAAVEQLNSGDSDSNIRQFSEELKMWEPLKPSQPAVPPKNN